MTWLPIVAFILLGAVFLDKSLRRSARRTWAWGRMGEGAPLSRTSYAILALMFFAIAFTLSRAPEPGLVAAIAVGVCFVSMIVAGFADTKADRDNRAGSQHGKNEDGS